MWPETKPLVKKPGSSEFAAKYGRVRVRIGTLELEGIVGGFSRPFWSVRATIEVVGSGGAMRELCAEFAPSVIMRAVDEGRPVKM